MQKKIDTLHKTSHTRVDWEELKQATKKAPTRYLIWAFILASKELPTGKRKSTRESLNSPACPRDFGKPAKDVPHILQFRIEDET